MADSDMRDSVKQGPLYSLFHCTTKWKYIFVLKHDYIRLKKICVIHINKFVSKFFISC